MDRHVALLLHLNGRLWIEFLRIELELFGHTSPILGIKVVVGTALDRAILVVIIVSRYSHDPDFLLDVIPPFALITKKQRAKEQNESCNIV